MSILKRSMILAMAAIGFFPASRSQAAVSLVLTDNDANPTVGSVAAGGTFGVTVKVISTGPSTSTNNFADTVAGLSYQLGISSGGIGKFFLVDRNLTGAPANSFSDFTASNPFVLDNTPANGFRATLSPLNGHAADQGSGDLGALLATTSAPISNNDPGGTATTPGNGYNPALVANYSIGVAANTTPGVYTLSISPINYTTYNSNTGQPGDGVLAGPPAASPLRDTFTVTVVAAPEPSSIFLLTVSASAFGLRRRRR